MSETERADAVTMDKIVSLCRRRGFVFPSSEIYGGLGSGYDYGHYGVLLKNNIRARWTEAMVRERDDVLLLDTAIILAIWAFRRRREIAAWFAARRAVMSERTLRRVREAGRARPAG